MAGRSAEKPTGAEAAVAVAEIGLAPWGAAKQVALEAVATFPGPESGSARTCWAHSASSNSLGKQQLVAAAASGVVGGCDRPLAPVGDVLADVTELRLDALERIGAERQAKRGMLGGHGCDHDLRCFARIAGLHV